MASAYRTISELAVVVIAGMIPVALLAKERQAMYKRKGDEPWLFLEKNANALYTSGNSLGKMKLEADGLRSSSAT